MAEQTRMNEDIYACILKKIDENIKKEKKEQVDCAWEENVVMLRKAIQHIDDKDDKLWKKIMKLIPGACPTPTKGDDLPGLNAILVIRKEISKYNKMDSPFDAFYQLENDLFPHTCLFEKAHHRDNVKKPLGYSKDGFAYCENVIEASSPELIMGVKTEISSYDSSITTGWYINGVDHFYTNLIWLVISGKTKQNAYRKATTPALLFSFIDCGILFPKNERDFYESYGPGSYPLAKEYPLQAMRLSLEAIFEE